MDWISCILRKDEQESDTENNINCRADTKRNSTVILVNRGQSDKQYLRFIENMSVCFSAAILRTWNSQSAKYEHIHYLFTLMSTKT